jgi:hypothetical protein
VESNGSCVELIPVYRFYTILLILLALAWCNAPSQTLVNKGALVHVAEKAVVTVNGNTVNSTGEIHVRDSARVTFNGNVDIEQGGLFLYDNSLAIVRRNLTIRAAGICYRYAPGSLRVEGTIFNQGDLSNEGEIVIGRP